MSSIQMSIEERVAALEQSVAEMKQSAAAAPVKKQSKKAQKAEAADGDSAESKPAKEPTAWNILVTATVADMRQNGWDSWTDLKGIVWSGSKEGVTVTVKDKKTGAESESCVFDGGDHDGKPPSPALGGMVRASYIKSLTDPAAKAKAEAYHAKLADKRSNASTGSGAREEPVADAPEREKKGGRPKMTEEQKAAAKLKREASKAAAAAAAVSEEVEMAEEEEAFEEVAAEEEESQTPKAVAPPAPAAAPAPPAPKPATAAPPAPAAAAAPKSRYGPPPPKIAGSSMAAIKAGVKASPKKTEAPKKVDISLIPWTFEGVEYFTNDRHDVVDVNTGAWVGRFNGTEIDESVPEPADFANGVPMREIM